MKNPEKNARNGASIEGFLTWEGQDLSSSMDAINQLAKATSADAMERAATAWSTESFGSSTTEPSPPDIRFTIETVTRLITELRTWKCSQPSSTSASILAAIRTISASGLSLADAAESLSRSIAATTDAETALALSAVHALASALSEIEKRGKRGNCHSTVKSTKLMSYLIRLITPPGGTVLDPFMGSGSTGLAAIEEGMDFVGIEQDQEYFDTAKERLGA